MPRRLHRIIAAVILLFGLFAGTGQSLALGQGETVSCLQTSMTIGSFSQEHSGCKKGMLHETCASDGVCSFLFLKNAPIAAHAPRQMRPHPVPFAGLLASHTPPETPPPIILS